MNMVTTYVQLHVCCLFLVAPTVTPEVQDQVENEGDIASFVCQAVGEPFPNITWLFNNVTVNENTNMNKYNITQTQSSIETSTVINTLRILNVQSSDVGTYTCKANNLISSDLSSGILTVNGEFWCSY